MANICTNEMEITGNKKDIATLNTKIDEQDEELLKLFCWFTDGGLSDYGAFFIQSTDESINVDFCSKWDFPVEALTNLGAAYPRLKFEAFYEEPAMDVFGKISCINGKVTNTFLTPLDYYSEYNEDFQAEREHIENLPYSELLSYTLQDDEYMYSYLDEIILKRIKDKDLPLFINYKWEHCEEKFTSRLQGD